MYNRRKTIALCLLLAGLLLLCAACSDVEQPSAAPSVIPSIEPSAEPTTEPSVEPSPFLQRVDDLFGITAPNEKWIAELAGNEEIGSLSLMECGVDVVLPEIPNLESFQIEWNGGEDGVIDLSACTALKSVTIWGKTLPNTLDFGQSVEMLHFNEFRGKLDEDYIASLPNLKWLSPNKSYDLAKLPPLERLSLFIGECDLSVLEDAEIEVLVVGGADTHGIHDETLSTFRGARSLRAMQISDEYITDISPILDHAPELEILLLSADESQENWSELNMTEVTSENAELLDLLESNIPRAQLDELIARGCTIRLIPDLALREPSV